MEVYYQALKELTDETYLMAISQLIKTKKTGNFPLPAEILEAAGDGSVQDRAVLAMTTVERAMMSVGAYSNVLFDDPIITEVVLRMGGWPSICALTENDWKFAKKDFISIYKAIAIRGIDIAPKPLSGIVEISNNASGYDCECTTKHISTTGRKALN